MNRIYKLVWNNVRGCYVVANEFAKAHGKSARRAVVGAFVAAAMVGCAASTYAAGFRAYEAGGGKATGNFSIAIGSTAKADANSGVALGISAWAEEQSSTAVGALAMAYGVHSSALGDHSTAKAYNSVAIGHNSVAQGDESVAIGPNSVATEANTVSVGSGDIKRKIVNVAAGSIKENSTDVVNGGQLFTEIERAKAAEKVNADAIATNNKAIIDEVSRAKAAEKANKDAITNNAKAITEEVSRAKAAEKVNADAIANNTEAITDEVARAKAAEQANTKAIAGNTKAITDEVTRAKAAEKVNEDAIATNTKAINDEAARAQAAELANRNNITTNAGNIAALRSDLSKDEARITKNEADIKVLATSGFFENKDNITFGESLTGNIVENSDGSHTFYIDVDKKSHVNFVDENRANLGVDLSSKGLIASDSRDSEYFYAIYNENGMTVENNNNQVSVSADGILVGNNPKGRAAGATSYVEITKEGIDMGRNKITNVAVGELSRNSAEAVNGSQLFATNEAVAANKSAIVAEENRAKKAEKANADAIANEKTERINADNELRNEIQGIDSNLTNKINQTNDRVDRVGATAAALAAINYQPMAKGQSQIAVGMGGYKGKKATALGLAYQITDRVSGSVAGSASGEERMFNVGFNYLFGQHSDKDIAQCAAVPGSMSLKEAELQAKVDSQDAKINNLEGDNAAMKARLDKSDADNAEMKAEIAELKAMVKALAAK